AVPNNCVGAQPNGRTASVLVGNDGQLAAPAWTAIVIETMNPPGGSDGPPIRLAAGGNRVYAAFIRCNSQARGCVAAANIANNQILDLDDLADIVIVRDDNQALLPNGNPNPNAFQDLTSGPGGALIGRALATGVTVPFGPPSVTPGVGTVLGSER